MESLSLAELVERTGKKRALLATVLSGEVALGRVRLEEDGRYAINDGALSPELVTALGALRF